MTPTSGRLQGKRALVTGAGSGIGQAVAERFALEGAKVGLIGRRAVALEETVEHIERVGGVCLATPCDVSQEDQVVAAVAAIGEAFGGLDAAVGVAGIELMGIGDDRIDRLELSIWQQTIDINLTGMFLTCKHATRAMLASGGGSITITGSPCGKLGFCTNQAAYSASKSGTHGLVRQMANDLASQNIRVNGVIPGFIKTPLTVSVYDDPEWLEQLHASIPMHRAGQPFEVAAMYAWLASDDASYVTGAFFSVDGGETAI
jgi:3-oxoacyl-[acyl-carrier protein] reductase